MDDLAVAAEQETDAASKLGHPIPFQSFDVPAAQNHDHGNPDEPMNSDELGAFGVCARGGLCRITIGYAGRQPVPAQLCYIYHFTVIVLFTSSSATRCKNWAHVRDKWRVNGSDD